MGMLSMMAVLLSFQFGAQMTPQPGEWVVIDSKEGPYSFAMPGPPKQYVDEVQTPLGKVRRTTYFCEKGDGVESVYLQHQRIPQAVQPDAALRAIETAMEKAGASKFEIVSKARIEVAGSPGLEIIARVPTANGKVASLNRTRLVQRGQDYFVMIAKSAADAPVSPETAAFFNSFRLDGQPAFKPVIPGAKAAATTAPAPASKAAMTKDPAPPPAKRKQLGRIDRVDTTADSALRTFIMAMEAGDEDTLRDVALPNPDIDWLLRGESTTAQTIKELKQQVMRARVERLKEGDRVKITAKETRVIRAAEVGRDHAALKIEGTPAYAPMERVKGRWKVDPTPIIAARKAASGAK
jgi:hypothetical protein